MAQLPTIKQIYRTDLGNEAPDWIEGLLSPMNQFMEEIYAALNKNLTVPQNVSMQIKTVNFRTASDYVANKTWEHLNFVREFPRRTQALMIGKIEDVSNPTKKFDAVTASWDDINGLITIYFLSGLENSKEYNCTFLLL